MWVIATDGPLGIIVGLGGGDRRSVASYRWLPSTARRP